MDYFRFTIALFAGMNLTHRIGSLFYPQFIWSGSRSVKEVFITFDDGPHPHITPWVLQELERVNAKATFFVVGENVKRFPEVTAQIEASGHSLGNHTLNHLNGWKSGRKEYESNIKACEDLLPNRQLFRPPYGKFHLQSTGFLKDYKVVMWDLLSMDYKKDVDCELRIQKMKRYTQNGSIVVFHDSEKAESNLRKILPAYLDYLKQNGFKMSAL